jgi:hypothetical protein
VWADAAPYPISDMVVDPSGEYAVITNFWGAIMAVKLDRRTGAVTPLRSSFTVLPNTPGRMALKP